MDDDDRERLCRLPLFDGLDAAERERLLQPAELRLVGPGETLFRQGTHAEYLYVLLHGAVELRGVDRDGNEAVVEVVQPVDCFILAAVVTDAPCLMAARSLQPSRLLSIPAGHLRTELRREPALALSLLAAMARHYRAMVRQIKDLKLRTSAERLGAFLLTLALEQGGSGQIELPYMKRVLAERMGMTPEHLSRAFARLRQRGVRIEGSHVIIDDIETLAAFCRVDTVLDTVERELRVPGLQPSPSDRKGP